MINLLDSERIEEAIDSTMIFFFPRATIWAEIVE